MRSVHFPRKPYNPRSRTACPRRQRESSQVNTRRLHSIPSLSLVIPAAGRSVWPRASAALARLIVSANAAMQISVRIPPAATTFRHAVAGQFFFLFYFEDAALKLISSYQCSHFTPSRNPRPRLPNDVLAGVFAQHCCSIKRLQLSADVQTLRNRISHFLSVWQNLT